jgi:hypothetical protein
LPADLGKPRLHALRNIGGADGDLEFVLQAVARSLGDLHEECSTLFS